MKGFERTWNYLKGCETIWEDSGSTTHFPISSQIVSNRFISSHILSYPVISSHIHFMYDMVGGDMRWYERIWDDMTRFARFETMWGHAWLGPNPFKSFEILWNPFISSHILSYPIMSYHVWQDITRYDMIWKDMKRYETLRDAMRRPRAGRESSQMVSNRLKSFSNPLKCSLVWMPQQVWSRYSYNTW